jgi:predicted  nucleic acid-binding Zn-ribbon protein
LLCSHNSERTFWKELSVQQSKFKPVNSQMKQNSALSESWSIVEISQSSLQIPKNNNEISPRMNLKPKKFISYQRITNYLQQKQVPLTTDNICMSCHELVHREVEQLLPHLKKERSQKSVYVKFIENQSLIVDCDKSKLKRDEEEIEKLKRELEQLKEEENQVEEELHSLESILASKSTAIAVLPTLSELTYALENYEEDLERQTTFLEAVLSETQLWHDSQVSCLCPLFDNLEMIVLEDVHCIVIDGSRLSFSSHPKSMLNVLELNSAWAKAACMYNTWRLSANKSLLLAPKDQLLSSRAIAANELRMNWKEFSKRSEKPRINNNNADRDLDCLVRMNGLADRAYIYILFPEEEEYLYPLEYTEKAEKPIVYKQSIIIFSAMILLTCMEMKRLTTFDLFLRPESFSSMSMISFQSCCLIDLLVSLLRGRQVFKLIDETKQSKLPQQHDLYKRLCTIPQQLSMKEFVTLVKELDEFGSEYQVSATIAVIVYNKSTITVEDQYRLGHALLCDAMQLMQLACLPVINMENSIHLSSSQLDSQLPR